MKTTYDAVVIGSGFGGAVAACRLAQAGLSVGLLERGRRYDGETEFPRDWKDPAKGWLWECEQGLFDVKPLREMLVVQGAGYGGGSLIYANVHLRPPAEVFAAGWPAGYSREALDPYFDLVAHMLDIRPITMAPAGPPPKTLRMADAARALGRTQQLCYPNLAVDFSAPGEVHVNKFGVRQAGCTYCGECDIGCRYRAKNTLDFNYLAVAEERGAEVRTRCEARNIVPSGGGYTVECHDHASGTDLTLRAKAVFVCAGAVNSTELLLRCREDHKSLPNLGPTLGQRYSGNGDFLAFAFDTDPPFEPSQGPTITAAVVYDLEQEGQRTWFTLQDGGYPREIGSLLQLLRPEGSWGRGAETWLREELANEVRRAAAERVGSEEQFPTSAVFLAMGRDRALGRLELHPNTRRLRIIWDLGDNLPLYGAESRLVADVVEKMGGKPGYNPLWERLHQPVSVHNLGGCAMADDPAAGVTDGEGQVHGYPGLYVLDGAILPSSTGVNPSHTIAAVAERNIERVVRRWQKAPSWQAPQRADAVNVVEPMSRIVIQVGGTLATRKLPVGLLFTETMKGFLAPAAAVPTAVADYVAAEKEGERAGRRAQFTLTITMADLDRFLVDAGHMGQAAGRVEITELTSPDGTDVRSGVFNLFERTEEFYERKMLYALPFVGADGADYRLDGFKEVKDNGHFDVWASTSTLYTVIRRGRSLTSPVVAAGVLRIHIPDFMHQLTTFRALGAETLQEKASAMLRFNKLFLGSLWKVFVAPRTGKSDGEG